MTRGASERRVHAAFPGVFSFAVSVEFSLDSENRAEKDPDTVPLG
jgi:hypothetical protein